MIVFGEIFLVFEEPRLGRQACNVGVGVCMCVLRCMYVCFNGQIWTTLTSWSNLPGLRRAASRSSGLCRRRRCMYVCFKVYVCVF